MLPTRINIVLFGIGNVGSTLIKQIIDCQDFFLTQHKLDLRFPVIANSSMAFFEKSGIKNNWEASFDKAAIPYKVEDIINFVQASALENLIAVDVTASEPFVYEYEKLISSGFHVVAANKKANTISKNFYKNLRASLQIHDKFFLYETNVGAGLPVLNTLRELYASGEKILKIRGVFSGALSFIFNQYSQSEELFSDILKSAVQKGYTEPDPKEDLSGTDVARKLLILARELGYNFELEDISVQSLVPVSIESELTTKQFLKELKKHNQIFQDAKDALNPLQVLRYVGTFDVIAQKLEVSLVTESLYSPLGQLSGSDNLIEIYTTSYNKTPIVIQGAGAGKEVTARGVLNDILKISDVIKHKALISA